MDPRASADSRPRPPLPRIAVLTLFAGLAVREAFSFWTGHPFDFESWVRTGYVVAQGRNPYVQFWPPVPGVSFGYLGQEISSAAYLPFWPALVGEIYRLWLAAGGGNRFVLYFLLKQPGIAADVTTAYLLFRLTERWTGSPSAAKGILAFWSFFPYAVVISAIWGQFDSLVVVVLLALFYARTPIERNVVHGVGIFVKWLTAIFLPLEIFRERGVRRLSFAVALALPLALSVAVFVAEGWTFAGIGPVALSQSHGEGQGMNYAFLLSLGAVSHVLFRVPYFYAVAVYLWVPGVIVAGWVAAKWVRPGDPRTELRAILLVLCVFLLLRWGLYEQYLLYLFSLMVLDVTAFHPGRRSVFLFTYVLGSVDLVVNNDLGLRFLSPIDTGLSAYTTQIDAAGPWSVVRVGALIVLSVAVTLTLVQLVRVYLRDTVDPRPWLTELPGRVRRAPPRP